MKVVCRFLIVVAAVVAAAKHANGGSGSVRENLYSVLDVLATASVKEIKSAYRRRARDTHPDKNRDVSAEESAMEFQRVVHAFEVLSDAKSRRRYDDFGEDGTGGGSSSSSSSSSYSHRQWQFFQGGRRRTVHVRDSFEAKQAQSRVLHIVSLDQLRTIMTDVDDRLERHLLLCFFTPGLEGAVNDEIVFPYPFAGMSLQSIWWEDILQTASVRFRRSNDLARYFGVDGGDGMTEPVFLFAKKGTALGESFDRGDASVYATKDRESFVKWGWSKMAVEVTFHNRHAHPVQIYWIYRNQANVKDTIEPGSSWVHYSMLTHEFYARDARVDAWEGSPGGWKLTTNSSLGRWKIGVEGKDGSPPVREDGSVTIDIPPRDCLDLSGHCSFWAQQDECKKNPTFMREKCMLTCGHCSEAEEDQTCKN